jgi:hypothetical protein
MADMNAPQIAAARQVPVPGSVPLSGLTPGLAPGPLAGRVRTDARHRGTGLVPRVLVALLPLSAVGCGGSDNPDMGPVDMAPATFAQVQAVISTSCLFSACHAMASTSSGNLSLADADAYCSLVGATQGATYLSTAKGQYPHRVVPGDKASSFLYQKLTLPAASSGAGKPLGTVMPFNQPLDAATISVFASWIDGGAHNKSGAAAPAGCM